MLLALDTATATASLALYDGQTDTLLAEWTWQARRRHTQDLLPSVQAMLDLTQLDASALTALAVTTGPGSFTGVRIGISTVKGVALGAPQPMAVIGVPTLSVTAAPWLALAASRSVAVWAVIQAGRGQYNWVEFEGADLLRRPAAHEHNNGQATDLLGALSGSAEQIWLVGEIEAELQAGAHELPHVQVVDNVSGLRRAGQLARLAERHLAAGARDDIATLQPLYLRAP